MSLRPAFRCECPHCAGAGNLFAPMIATRPGAFTLRCLLDDCNRMRAFQYLEGHVDFEVKGREIWFYSAFKMRGGHLEVAADIVRDAVDLHLIGQLNTDPGAKDAGYRGAAVHLRVATEVLVGGYVMEMDEIKIRDSTLGQLIGQLSDGWPWRRIKADQRSIVLSSLDYLAKLGDTAAHPLLQDPRREVPPTRGNLEIGFSEFDKVADAVRIH